MTPAIDIMSGEYFDVELAHKLGPLPTDGLAYLRCMYIEDVRANDKAATQVIDWWLACHAPALSPAEAAIVARFEAAPDPYLDCWDAKCSSHEDGYVGSPDSPPEGEFVQRHEGNSNVHIVRTVEDDCGAKKVTVACGVGWYASALRHANGDSPRQCAKCWEVF